MSDTGSPRAIKREERSRSPVNGDRRVSTSPAPRRRSPSPERQRNRSPMRRRSNSPVKQEHQDRSRSRSPVRRRVSRSPVRERERRIRSRSRDRDSRRSRSRSRDRGRRSPAPQDRRSPPRRRSPPARGTQLFVAGLNFITTEREVESKFAHYGRVKEVRIVRHPRTGESRGFGFVVMEQESSCHEAIRELDGRDWQGRRLDVEVSKNPR